MFLQLARIFKTIESRSSHPGPSPLGPSRGNWSGPTYPDILAKKPKPTLRSGPLAVITQKCLRRCSCTIVYTGTQPLPHTIYCTINWGLLPQQPPVHGRPITTHTLEHPPASKLLSFARKSQEWKNIWILGLKKLDCC